MVRVVGNGHNDTSSNPGLILNWIVWNRNVYMYKDGFGINNLGCLVCIKPNQNKSDIFNIYL